MEFTYVNDDGEESIVDLPTKMEVCRDCEGKGKTYLGWRKGDQPAFTQADRDEDPDGFEDMMSGHYDRDCQGCNGLRVVEIVDADALEAQDKALWNFWVEDKRAEHEHREICRMEERMGC